jgi:hypothetical protein
MSQIPPPEAKFDQKARVVTITQQHPLIIGQPQTVVLSFMFLKKLAALILEREVEAEVMSGNPAAVPPSRQAPPNGRPGGG